MLWPDFEYSLYFLNFFFIHGVCSPFSQPSGSESFSSIFCRITEALGLVQSMIGVKPAPQEKEGERHGLCLAMNMNMVGTADPRPKGVCGGRLHQLKCGKLGVIWHPVVFIAVRSFCKWFGCREKKQDFVPKVVLVAFLVSFFLILEKAFLQSFSHCHFTAMASSPLCFLLPLLPFSTFSSPQAALFPCATCLLLAQSGLVRSWSTSASLNPSALLPGNSDLPLPSTLCKNVSVQI